MRNFIIRIIINALAIAVTAYVMPGIEVTTDLVPLLIVGVILTIINATVKPILSFLTFPLTILTLGLFILVINALMLSLAAYFSGGALTVDGWWPAILGAIVLAIVNMVLERITGTSDQQPAKK
jgi:putative membrane protein